MYKKKLDVPVSYELTQKNLMHRISIYESLLNCNKSERLLVNKNGSLTKSYSERFRYMFGGIDRESSVTAKHFIDTFTVNY